VIGVARTRLTHEVRHCTLTSPKWGAPRMRRIDQKGLRAPARVLDLELAPVDQVDEDPLAVEQYNTMWCLSRIDGVPQEISFWDVTEDASVSIRGLRDRLRTGRTTNDRISPGPPPPRTASLDATVVICTRDRPVGLRATLASLERQTDSNFGVLVVDNGPSSPESATVVEELGLPRCEYLVEPRPGLARARNRALGAVRTDLVAWIDDDEVADPDWVRRLKEGFAHKANPAAVCGVMLPAELEFEAQVRFEQYGGFNKGRGMAPEVLRMGTSSLISPLYPLPAFGPGGNMAFQTESLRSVEGFDPCLGAGTRTHGCEETRVLSLLLSSGHAVLHWPAAITWHTHRREMAALRKQIYGYSAGLSAFYVSMIRSRPTAAFDVLRLAPYALRDLKRGSGNLRSGQLPDDFPAHLLKAARRGILEGGFMYAYEAIRDRRQSLPVAQEGALSGDLADRRRGPRA
jgi:glycosyltransferase involved in cell wall biosynthesis